MPFDPNRLFFTMAKIYRDASKKGEKVIICNSGGSRAGKTFDAFHFIYLFCNHNENKNNDIYILRDTLTNCRDYTFKDFQSCMNLIPATNIEYSSMGMKPYVRLFGNNIYFRGLDDETRTSDKSQGVEGYPSDIIFVNEALETRKTKIDGLKMRCRKLMIMDWNPKFTDHWCFDMEGQENVYFTHSTYKDNKHLEKSIIKEIESYCPWNFDDANLPEKERRPNLKNIKEGTADRFRWNVYGLGLKTSYEGLIFKYVNYIDSFPDIGYCFGMDFGWVSDPTAIVKVAETETDIYLELLCYEPIETPETLDLFMSQIGIDRGIPITADSSDKYTGENKGTVEMVKGLRMLGWLISKVSKTKSIMFWLLSMKKKRINVVNNHLVLEFKKEFENYRMKMINGIAINQPIDGFDHGIAAGRYGHMSLNQTETKPFIW